MDNTRHSLDGIGPTTDESLTPVAPLFPQTLASALTTQSLKTIATRLRSSSLQHKEKLSFRAAMEKEFMADITTQVESFAETLKGSHNRRKRRELPTFTGEKHHNALAWLELAQKLREFNKISTTTDE